MSDQGQAQESALLGRLVQTSADPVLIVGVHPGAQGAQVVYTNAALRRLWPDFDLEILQSAALGNWPGLKADYQALESVLLEGDPGLLDRAAAPLELYLPDQGTWWAVRVHAIGPPTAAVAHRAYVFLDITLRKRSEALIQTFMSGTALALRGQPLAQVMPAMLEGINQIDGAWTSAVLVPGAATVEVYGALRPEQRALLESTPAAQLIGLWRQRDPAAEGRPQIIRAGQHPALVPGRPAAAPQTTLQFPLYDAQKVLLGVLLAQHSEAVDPNPELLAVLGAVASHVAMMVARERDHQALVRQAFQDELTGLLNRAGFVRELDLLIAECQQSAGTFALGFLDLNRFKAINDAMGHSAGDDVLTDFARRLRAVAGAEPLTSMARMGGDEFIFVLRGVGRMDAVRAALLAAVQAPFTFDAYEVTLDFGLGWSVYPDLAPDRSELMRQAEAAMYRAKRSGEHSCLFSHRAQPRIAPLMLESSLRAAVAQGELQLVFQPQVSAATLQVTGAEALVRWTHPSLGPISPNEFIPLADVSGVIHELGRWVLKEACQTAMTWPANLQLSVNLSVVQLRLESFEPYVLDILRGSGLPPARLTLELTETALVQDLNRVGQTLRRLRSHGVRISVDDFGTGYSTLATLRHFPADELKIDRSFIGDLLRPGREGRENQAIVQATIGLARGLGLSLIAEGVETAAQAAWLSAAGCDCLQGWLIAPGLSAEAFAERYGG